MEHVYPPTTSNSSQEEYLSSDTKQTIEADIKRTFRQLKEETDPFLIFALTSALIELIREWRTAR